MNTRTVRTITQLLVAAIAATASTNILAVNITNTYTSVSNFPGAYAINPSAGNSQVDIWSSTNGASFIVTTNLYVGLDATFTTAATGNSTLILDGSTNYVRGTPPLPGPNRAFEIHGAFGSTSLVSLINNAMLVVTNYAEMNSAGLAILSLSNSTMIVTGNMQIDYSSIASSTNRMIMVNSTLDMRNSSLTVGGSGGYGEASLQNSILTNVSLGISSGNPNGSYGLLTASNSVLYTVAPGSYGMVVGNSSNRTGSLVLDHSTWNGVGGWYLVGGHQGGTLNSSGKTGMVTLANGTVANLASTVFSLGRAGSVGQLAVSNSSLTVAMFDIGGWVDVIGNEAYGGRATVLLHSGTNTATTHAWMGTTSNTVADFTADGSSLVVSPSLVIGYAFKSTNTFTIADSTLVIVTNAAHTAALEVGPGGQGTFTMNGGTVNVDKLLASNGSSSLINFNGGTLNTRSTIVSNLSTFTVGNGVDAATLHLVGGTHSFAGGLTIANNGILNGTGTVQGATTVFGTLAPGNSPGIITVVGNLTLGSGSALAMDLNGTTPGTGYDQVVVTGGVNIVGGNLNLTLGFVPSTGTVFTLINNDSIDPVSGTFAGLGNGSEFTVPGMPVGQGFNIRYNGGTGNDVTLLVIPEPTFSTLLLSGAIAVTAITRRKGKHETSSK